MSFTPQIQARINEIAAMITAGKRRKHIIAECGEKWKIQKTIVDKYIREAKKISEKRVEKAAQLIEKKQTEVISDMAARGLRSSLEVDLAVQDIIFNNFQLVKVPMIGKDGKTQKDPDGQPVYKVVKVENTTNDKLRAAELYYRRQNLLGKGEVKGIEIYINGKKGGEE